MNDVKAAASAIRQGKLVVYPTDTLYGLGADVFNEEAVEHVYQVKHRPGDMPLPVAVGSIEDIETVAHLNETARALAAALLPGALTVVLPKRLEVPEQVAGDTIAVRVPDHEMALQLCRRAGAITTTSANLHGSATPATIGEARKQLSTAVDLYLDGGRLPGVPSTVVDATGRDISIIREGAIKEEQVYDITR